MNGELNQRFSFRKLSVGLAGVALSSFWLAGTTGSKAHAAETDNAQTPHTKVVNNETPVAGASQDNAAHSEANAKTAKAGAVKAKAGSATENSNAIVQSKPVEHISRLDDALKSTENGDAAKVVKTAPMKSIGNPQKLDAADLQINQQLNHYSRAYAANGLTQSLVASGGAGGNAGITPVTGTDGQAEHVSQIPDISDDKPAEPGENRNEYVIYGWGSAPHNAQGEKELLDKVDGLGEALSNRGYHINYSDFNQRVSRTITVNWPTDNDANKGNNKTISQTGNLHRILAFINDQVTHYKSTTDSDGHLVIDTSYGNGTGITNVDGYPRLTAGAWMLRTSNGNNPGTADANTAPADGVLVKDGALYFKGLGTSQLHDITGYTMDITDSTGKHYTLADLQKDIKLDTDTNNAVLFGQDIDTQLVPPQTFTVNFKPISKTRTITFVDDDNSGARVPTGGDSSQLNSVSFDGTTDQTRTDLGQLVQNELDKHKYNKPDGSGQADTYVVVPGQAALSSFKLSADPAKDNSALVIHVKHNIADHSGNGPTTTTTLDQDGHNVYAMTHIDNVYTLHANVPAKYLPTKDVSARVQFHRTFNYDPIKKTYSYNNDWTSDNAKYQFKNGEIDLDSVSQLFHNNSNISTKNINHYKSTGTDLSENGVNISWVNDSDTQGHYKIATSDLLNLNNDIFQLKTAPNMLPTGNMQSFASTVTWTAQSVPDFVFHFRDTTNNPHAQNKGTININVPGTIDSVSNTKDLFDVNNAKSPIHGMVKEGNIPDSVSFENVKDSQGNWNIAPVTTDYNVHQNIATQPTANIGELGLTDHDVHRVFTRTITAKTNGGDIKTTTQTIEFRRDAYADPALDSGTTKGVVYGDWTITGQGYTDTGKKQNTATNHSPNGQSASPVVTLNPVDEAGRPGYKMVIDGNAPLPDGQGYTVPKSIEINADTEPNAIHSPAINYISQAQQVSIRYIDQDHNEQIPNTPVLTFNGTTDQTVSIATVDGSTIPLDQYIKNNAPKHWDIVSGVVSSYTFKPNDNTVIQIMMKHHHDTIPDTGDTSNLDPHPDNPQDVKNTATEDVYYINQDQNTPKYHSISRSINFHRGGDYDEITKHITPAGNWIADVKPGESSINPKLNSPLTDNAQFDAWQEAPLGGYDAIAETSRILGTLRL